MRIILTFTGIICLFQTTFSQFDNSIKNPDTTRFFFPKTHGLKVWRPLLGFDAHRSFFAGTPVKINGLRVGVEYLGTHRFGFGFYGLQKDEVFVDVPVDFPSATDTSLVKFKVNYTSLFYERVLFKTAKWEMAIPIYLGAGGLEGFVEDSVGVFYRFTATSFSLISSGVVMKYYLFKWLALRTGVGVRLLFNTEKSVKQAFNRPYYSFGVNILLGEIIQSYKKFNTRKNDILKEN